MPETKGKKFTRFITKAFRRLERLLFLVKSLISPRQFIYLSCVLVGISSALAVIVLKTFAHWVYKFAQYIDGFLHLPYSNSAFPIIGILLTIFIVKKVLDGELHKGTAQIMNAVARKNGILPRKQMYSQIITSSFTVGMGKCWIKSPITILWSGFWK